MVIELILRIPYNESQLEILKINEGFYEPIEMVNDTSVLGIKRVPPFTRPLVWLDAAGDGVTGDVCLKMRFDTDEQESDSVSIPYQLLLYFSVEDNEHIATEQLSRLNLTPEVFVYKGHPYIRLIQGE